jgi:hypothetical protein
MTIEADGGRDDPAISGPTELNTASAQSTINAGARSLAQHSLHRRVTSVLRGD